MAEEDDRDLPLHDEAEARSKWRGGETILDGDGASGPASEVDDGGSGAGGSLPADDPIARPPD